MIGTTLQHYEILDRIGRGGMGEVYRARDTKLDRDVAIKLLVPEFSQDPERMARFEREAKTLASIQHPNIASIYGFETTGEHRFLVMELVEGEDLAERLHRGAIPVEDALDIARRVARGMEDAHDKGIVHRDLKPANIKLDPSGEVKILDFGLARALGDDPSDGDVANSPTITAAMTKAGVILGTAAYMSPEQARGHAVDKRADIWAFGCVLYQMLTGEAPFAGDTITDVLADVVRSEPNWEALPSDLPARVKVLLWRCLQKDPRRRLRDIGEARFELGEAPSDPTGSFAILGTTLEARPRRWPWAAAAAGAGLVLGLLVGALLLGSPGASSLPEREPLAPTRFLLSEQELGPLGLTLWNDVALSPDGRRIALTRRRGGPQGRLGLDVELAIRDLSSREIRVLVTEGQPIIPIFSPDGREVAYGEFASGRLMKIPVEGGQASVVADSVGALTGGVWARDGNILLASSAGELIQVPASGGEQRVVAEAEIPLGSGSFNNPALSPNGRSVLVGVGTPGDEDEIQVWNRDTGEIRPLIPGTFPVGFTPAGHLLFVRENTLLVQPMDGMRPVASPVSLVDGVSDDIAVTHSGTLVYRLGVAGDTRPGRFVWMDREGNVVPIHEEVIVYPRYPRISPDGTKVVHTMGPAGNGQLWIRDVVGTQPPLNLTFGLHNTFAVWSPDGRQIAFNRSVGTGSSGLYLLAADGSEMEARALDMPEGSGVTCAWTRNDAIVFNHGSSDAVPRDIFQVPSSGGEHEALVATRFNEGYVALSQDERWLAYESDRSGQTEIWVQPYPQGVARRVSSDGGQDPVWSKQENELYYQRGTALMAVRIEGDGDEPTFGAPVELFRDNFLTAQLFTPRTYDTHPDGRFLMIQWVEDEEGAKAEFEVVQNWVEGVDRRVSESLGRE